MEIQPDEIEKSRRKSQYFSYGFCDNYVTHRAPSDSDGKAVPPPPANNADR